MAARDEMRINEEGSSGDLYQENHMYKNEKAVRNFINETEVELECSTVVEITKDQDVANVENKSQIYCPSPVLNEAENTIEKDRQNIASPVEDVSNEMNVKELLPDISSLLQHDKDLANLTADITAALDNCKPQTEEFDKDNPLDILSLCSATAQHLKDTINEVLKSRDVPKKESVSDIWQSKLADDIKEKIAELEHSFSTSTSIVKEKEREMQKCNSETLTFKKMNQTESSESNGNLQRMPIIENDNNQNREKENEEKLNTVSEQTECIRTAEISTMEKSITEEESSSITSESFKQKQPNAVMSSSDGQDKSYKKVTKGMNSNKRKGEKTIDQVTKALACYESTEEKLQALYKKHVELLEEQRSQESRLKQNERFNAQIMREREQLQADHNRAVLAKSKLEGLCRELQRQNKVVKEESLLRIREEEEKRKELVGKFQTTLNDITTLMQENQQRSSELKDENIELAQKLKSLVDHYDLWEKHMGKVLRQKDLECQLAKAKLAKTAIHLKQEQENFLREKHQLLENINDLQKRSTELASTELQLRNELSLYTSKYDEFQGVLRKSNDIFGSFKNDMETMSKKIKKLQKETSQWRTRWENSNRALLEMAAEKQKRDQELLASHQRVLTLEKLCRALQTERIELQAQLKIQHQNKEEPCETIEEVIQCDSIMHNKDSFIVNEEHSQHD